MSVNIFLSVIVLLSTFSYIAATGCEINPYIGNSPLLISPGNTSIIYPDHGKKTVKFHTGETVEFACPGRRLVIDGTETQAIVEATCISNTKFRLLDKNVLWGKAVCNRNPIIVGRYLNSNCGTNARLAEVGFNLGNNRFLRTMTVCFDTKQQSTLYSQFDLTASINSWDTTTQRPQFSQDNGFYNVPNHTVNQLYVRGLQRSTINGLLGLASGSTKYIKNDNLHYLSRGHITARADFVYGAEQNASFRYINAAPQWQSFNGRNWAIAETNTRMYAHNKNVNLKVWTGTYGIATLPHEKNNDDIQLYLYVNGNNRAIPVPAIFWKIVYNPINKEGIVLIGLNNPYETNVEKHIICPDISSTVNWLNWNNNNIARGYLYACTVANFRKVVTYAPNVRVSGLLL